MQTCAAFWSSPGTVWQKTRSLTYLFFIIVVPCRLREAHRNIVLKGKDSLFVFSRRRSQRRSFQRYMSAILGEIYSTVLFFSGCYGLEISILFARVRRGNICMVSKAAWVISIIELSSFIDLWAQSQWFEPPKIKKQVRSPRILTSAHKLRKVRCGNLHWRMRMDSEGSCS